MIWSSILWSKAKLSAATGAPEDPLPWCGFRREGDQWTTSCGVSPTTYVRLPSIAKSLMTLSFVQDQSHWWGQTLSSTALELSHKSFVYDCLWLWEIEQYQFWWVWPKVTSKHVQLGFNTSKRAKHVQRCVQTRPIMHVMRPLCLTSQFNTW